jgi:hypothetical protein
VWSEVERHYFVLDIGLLFMEALPIEEVKGYLRGRVAQLEAVLQYLDTHQDEQLAHPEVPRLAVAIFDHTRVHFQAELAWAQDLLDKVERGEYP